MERKVPKYEYHKVRERKEIEEITVVHRVFSCAYPTVISSISGKSFHFPFPYFVKSKNHLADTEQK